MAKSPSNDVQSDPKVKTENKLSDLRKLPAFKGITVDAMNKLLETASKRLVSGGDYVFRENEPASSLVIFSEGLAVEFKRAGEVDCLLTYYAAPAVLGESSFLESSCRSRSLYANEDCWVTEIDNHHLQALMELSPEQYEVLFANLGKELGRKLSTMNEKLNQAEESFLIRESSLNWDQY
ncbi:cyclic nucleotide-binding domain-containing protein [Opitutia bacterium ISCC 51]|nr:cyclic nucleotide-binding domain-containing protein [Opitutae bacterium ISCC 51]QXD26581.1 cyclic nucleotide-binding domain-containing protein [Opitutae bacterium ISCC 52]